jgi:hypothetical protein
MSATHSYSIVCPKCEARQDVELYDAINVQEAPALRDVLMANELNAVVCPHCSFQFRVDKRLLYNDPERRFMIYWMPGSESGYQQNKDEFMKMMEALNQALPSTFDPPAVHLVFRRAELVERIYLLEAELNERVIEYIKYMMYSRNLEKIEPARKLILFNAEDSTDERLCFVVQNLESMQLEGMLQFDRSAYEGLLEMFDSDEKTASLMELFPGPYVSARQLFLQDVAG